MEEYAGFTDTKLIQLLQTGDEMAYKEIYNRYWQILFRFSRKLLQDSGLAEDVVQDVFTLLWLKREQLGLDAPLAATLYTATRHKILDKVKHSKVESRYLAQLDLVSQQIESLPDQLYIEKELFDKIELEIANLPDKMRVIFEKSRKEYKSNQQIADELGISQQTVKNQISNAIRSLRARFGDKINVFLIFF